jgi:hypothetical protein
MSPLCLLSLQFSSTGLQQGTFPDFKFLWVTIIFFLHVGTKSKLLYDRRPVTRYVLVLSPLWHCDCDLWLVFVWPPLWLVDGSAVNSAITQWSESRRTRNHTLLSHLRFHQPGAEAEVTLRLTVGQSVSQSVRLGVEPTVGLATILILSEFAVLSLWGALSDERLGLSLVSYCQQWLSMSSLFCIFFPILHITRFMYVQYMQGLVNPDFWRGGGGFVDDRLPSNKCM